MAPVLEPPPSPESDGSADPVADDPAAVPDPVVDELPEGDVEDVVWEVDPDDVEVDEDEDEVEELVVVVELVEEDRKFTKAVLTI